MCACSCVRWDSESARPVRARIHLPRSCASICSGVCAPALVGCVGPVYVRLRPRACAPARAAISYSHEFWSHCLSGNATLHKTKWLLRSRTTSVKLPWCPCPHRPPDGARGSKMDPIAPLAPPWASDALPPLACWTRFSTGLGVKTGPSDRMWTIAAVQAEAGKRKGAGCPRGARRVSCGLIRFGRVPWYRSSLETGLQSCPRAAGPSIEKDPPGRSTCFGFWGSVGRGLVSPELREER